MRPSTMYTAYKPKIDLPKPNLTKQIKEGMIAGS